MAPILSPPIPPPPSPPPPPSEGAKAEELYAKDGTLPDPDSTDNPEFQIVLRLIRDGLAADPTKWSRMAKCIVGVSEETTTGVKRLYEMTASVSGGKEPLVWVRGGLRGGGLEGGGGLWQACTAFQAHSARAWSASWGSVGGNGKPHENVRLPSPCETCPMLVPVPVTLPPTHTQRTHTPHCCRAPSCSLPST
jgi:hypothetical protein